MQIHNNKLTTPQKTTHVSLSKFLPLYLVFLSITILSLIRQFLFGPDFMTWMMDFMGIFFMIFGLFKLYDLKGFVTGFSTYDVIAKKWIGYGYIFPFIEIFLGGMYLLGYMFLWQNLLALVISGLGIYSAYKVIRSKNKILCVCLGTAFNLPMTNITLIENTVMFAMVLFMLAM